MAKISLGIKPKTIARTISVPRHDGSTGTIGVQYRYRTRTEFGAFVDTFFKSAPPPTPEGEAAAAEAFSALATQQERVESNARYLLATIDSWDLDVPFTEASARQLSDEDPAATLALMNGYREAVSEGRLGN